MKKIIGILLVVSLITCIFVGCSNNKQGENSLDPNESNNDVYAPIPEDPNAPKLEYKMAFIDDITVNGERRVSYIVEVTNGNFDISSNTMVVETEHGHQLKNYELYKGAVCKSEGTHEFETEEQRMKYDYPTLTIIVYPDDNFNKDNISVQLSLNYCTDLEKYSETKGSAMYNCYLNADMSELTPDQDFIHRNNLIFIGSSYYLLNYDSGGITGDLESEVKYKNLYLLSGNPTTDFENYFDNIDFVDKDGNLVEFDTIGWYDSERELIHFGIKGEMSEEYVLTDFFPLVNGVIFKF